MSEERKVNLVVAAENQTKGALQEIKQDAANMAQSVEQSGKKAAKGLDGIGAGGEQAAKKLDGSARSIIGSIQRTTATMEAGEKGTAKYFEALAKQRNVSGDVLEPYLAQLRKAEAAQAAAVGSLTKMGQTAGQTRLALQQLPMQFQDIVVSLQAGQKPLTVMLQQGSQLSGSFGGAAAAAKAMGSYLIGLVNPLTVVGAGVAALGAAYYTGSKEQDAFVRSIVMTGNASGVTASQLRDYARQIDAVVGTQAQAAAGLAAFTAAGVRGGEELKRYTQTAIEWEKATGQAVEKTAEQFASLKKDPLTAVLKLNDGTNFLTLSVYEQIKALEEQGDKAGAAEVAMNALDTAMRERGKAIQENLGYIEAAWKGITGAAKNAWDAMLNVGRPASLEDQLSEVQKSLADAVANQGWGETEGGAATGRVNSAYLKQIKENISALREQEHALMRKIDAERLNAVAQEEAARVTQARTEFDKKYASALQSEISLKEKLARARKEAEAAGKSEADITKVLAYVTEEHNKSLKKGGEGRKAAQSSYQSLMVAINQSVAASNNELEVGEKLTESQKLRIKYEQELATRKRAFTEQEKQNIEAGLLAAEAAEKQAAAYKELAKAWEDDAKAFDSHIKKQQALVASINSTVDKLRLEEEGHMLAAAANISHAEAMERITLARLEEAQAQMLQGAGSQEEIERINREIEARKKLLGLLGQRAAREANDKAAKDAAKEWEKTAQTIGDTLADYIMSGGKDAATYLKRLFSTLVLQPVVQAGVGGVMQSLGVGGAPASGSSMGNVASMLQNGNSLYGALTGSLTYGLGSAIAGMGTALGSAAATSFGAGMAASGFTAGAFSTGASMVGAGATSTGLGMMAGAALPWVAGGAAILSLASNLIHKETPHTGAAAQYAGGSIVNFGKGFTKEAANNAKYTAGMQSAISGLASTIGGSLDSLAEMFGKNSGYSVSTGFTSDNDDKSHGLFRVTNAEGDQLIQWLAKRSGEYGSRATGYSYNKKAEKGYDEYLQSVSAATIPLFKEIVPAWADDMLDGLSKSWGFSGNASDWKSINVTGAQSLEALNQVLQQIAQVKATFGALGKSMEMFEGISDSVQTTLLNVSGGIEVLASNAQSFYANYFSEQERLDATVADLAETFAKYGVVLPTTAEQYRALVEQQMAAGDAGAEFAAVLLGLNGTFKQVADAWKGELEGMAQSVAGVFEGVYDSIGSLLVDIERDRKSILRGTGVMTAAEIAAGIVGAGVLAPSMLGISNAKSAVDAAGNRVANATAGNTSAQAALANAQAKRNAANAARDSVAGQINSVDAYIAHLNQKSFDLWGDGGAKRGYSLSKRKKWQREIDADMGNQQALRAQLEAQLQPLAQAAAQQQSGYDAVAAAAKTAAEQLASAQKALAAAQQAELRAKAAYAAKMAQFVVDAGASVSKLSDLRGEVVSFYEAQAQAVQGMLQSAGNLRSIVDQVRLGQLSTAQTAQELGNRYATDYSMALATTGSTRAGYVDAMTGNLQGLAEALKAEAVTGAEWRVQTAKLLAQATNAAGLLEGDAESDNYQDVALGLLDNIDKALESLSGVAKSAEQVIADAVNNGTASTLTGLRAVVAALQGKPIPAFAVGTNYVPRDMVAQIHEGEAIVPKAFNPWAGGGMPAVGGDTSRLEALLVQQVEENRVQAARMVDLQLRMNKLLERWDTMGMPEEREVAA